MNYFLYKCSKMFDKISNFIHTRDFKIKSFSRSDFEKDLNTKIIQWKNNHLLSYIRIVLILFEFFIFYPISTPNISSWKNKQVFKRNPVKNSTTQHFQRQVYLCNEWIFFRSSFLIFYFIQEGFIFTRYDYMK